MKETDGYFVIFRSTVPTSDASKPAFTRVLGEFYHITEDDLILNANVRAVPEPKISWFKDGAELTAATDTRYDFSTDHDGCYQFRIHKPTEADSALYACEAVNSEGKAKVTHKVNFTELERHTHPQFVYHKESFWQPTLRMEIEPEPVREASPEISRAATQSTADEANVSVSQDTSSSGNQESGEGAGDSSGVEGGSGSGGDGNEEGEEGKEISDGADGAEPKVGEEEEKKPEKRARGTRRKRYEGPFEPLLIRDSVSC